MMRKLHTQQAGFTIVEVLVAAVIFMVGFSILISLLNSTLVKFSLKEQESAANLAHEFMTRTLAAADTTALDSVINRSKIDYRVRRRVGLDGSLAAVSITVFRDRNQKKLIELCNAFLLAEE